MESLCFYEVVPNINDINESCNSKRRCMIEFSSPKDPKGDNSWFKANDCDNMDHNTMFYLLGLILVAILHH